MICINANHLIRKTFRFQYVLYATNQFPGKGEKLLTLLLVITLTVIASQILQSKKEK